MLGAGGLVGRHVVAALGRSGDEVLALSRRDCDIADLGAVVGATRGADRIVNCAAYTDVEAAESNEDAAYRVNALGTECLARAAERHGAALVHLSTDFVFDGTKSTPYDELDEPHPLGVYARSKWAGERLAREVTRRLFVVRVQGVFGEGGKNFASRIPDLVAFHKAFSADGERHVQPTWARTLASQILTIGRTELFGTYHVSTKGKATWAEVAEHVATRLGAPSTCTSVPTAALSTRAVRPKNSLFSHRMLALRGLDRMPTWQEDVDAYLATRKTPSDEVEGQGS